MHDNKKLLADVEKLQGAVSKPQPWVLQRLGKVMWLFIQRLGPTG
jgi:hypothetical protein